MISNTEGIRNLRPFFMFELLLLEYDKYHKMTVFIITLRLPFVNPFWQARAGSTARHNAAAQKYPFFRCLLLTYLFYIFRIRATGSGLIRPLAAASGHALPFA